MRTTALVTAVLGGAALLVGLAAAPASATPAATTVAHGSFAPFHGSLLHHNRVGGTFNQNGYNWSGYAASGSGFTSVSASWVEPKVTCNSTNDLYAPWVGIDGYGNHTVEQLGTEWTATGGYRAWVEFSGDPVPLEFSKLPTIQPGDTVSAEIAYVSSAGSNSTFQLAFSVLTPSGQTESWSAELTTSSMYAQQATGEWIVEAPGYGHSDFGPLANFGTVTFTGAWATAGSTTGGISSFTNYAINMDTTGSGGGTADVSSVTASSALGFQEPSGSSSVFNDTFESANPAVSAKAAPADNSPAVIGDRTDLLSTQQDSVTAW